MKRFVCLKTSFIYSWSLKISALFTYLCIAISDYSFISAWKIPVISREKLNKGPLETNVWCNLKVNLIWRTLALISTVLKRWGISEKTDNHLKVFTELDVQPTTLCRKALWKQLPYFIFASLPTRYTGCIAH